MTNHRGATRHDILPGGRYPGQDLYDVLLARCERAEAEVERLQARVKELETGILKFLNPRGPEAFGLERLPFDPDDYPISFDPLASDKPR